MNHLVSPAPFVDKLRDHFDGMLQISVHGNYSIALGICQAGEKRVLVSKVS